MKSWLLPSISIVIWILWWVVTLVRTTDWMAIGTFYAFLDLLLVGAFYCKEQHAKQTGVWFSAQVEIREELSLPVIVILTVILCSIVTIINLMVLSDVSLSWLAWNTHAALTTAFIIFLTQDEKDQQNQIFHEPLKSLYDR